MTIEDLKPLLTWLNQHPHWAGVATCLVVFTETLAIVGLVIPGVVLMTAIGTLVGSGVIPAWEIFAWATVGSVAGDTLSYWLGRHYHSRIQEIWPFRLFPDLFKKGQAFFARHGGKSVFIGRFLGPLRAIIPLIAGTMNMGPIRFVATSIVASIIWAPAYMLPGLLIGAASQQLAPETATNCLIIVFVALITFWGIFWLLQRIFQCFLCWIDAGLSCIWRYIQTRSYLKPLQILLQENDKRYSSDHHQLTLFISLIILFTAFIILAINILHQGTLTYWNIPLLHFFHGIRANTMDKIMIVITTIAEFSTMITLLAIVFIWLLCQKSWRAAFHWLSCGSAAIIIASIVRKVVHSPRPSGLNFTQTSWSFPSGHTTSSISLFGFLAVLITSQLPTSYRKIIYRIAALVCLLIIYSRLYLGAHWISDVCGGILLALSCVIATTLSYRRKAASTFSLKQLVFVVFCTLILATSINLKLHYREALSNYGLKDWPDRTLESNEWWARHTAKPLFRTNRFGSPIQTINVQWAAHSIDEIEQLLMEKGWQDVPRLELVSAVNQIAAKDQNLQLPMFTQLYQDHKPDLIMTKYIEKENKLLILRLWDSNTTLIKPSMHLWIGTLNYHEPWHPQFIWNNKNRRHTKHVISAVDGLLPDIKKTKWKKISYISVKHLNNKQDADWSGYVLYIQSEHP